MVTKFNEAETDSLALRLASLFERISSVQQLLVERVVELRVKQAIYTATSFQITS